jgi:hypothetical protein
VALIVNQPAKVLRLLFEASCHPPGSSKPHCLLTCFAANTMCPCRRVSASEDGLDLDKQAGLKQSVAFVLPVLMAAGSKVSEDPILVSQIRP